MVVGVLLGRRSSHSLEGDDMGNQQNFLDWFINTDELEVCRALANEMYRKPGTLSEVELGSLASNLWTMDEGHVSSAVIILSHHDPVRLLPHLPRLLGDPRTGVWSAAERALLLLPKKAITAQIIREFRSIIMRRSGTSEDSYAIKMLVGREEMNGDADRK